MISYLGDFAEDATVYIMFNTFSSNDPSASVTITNFANTDVHIHKDNNLTQRTNAAGITVSVDFDGITGSHMIAIDTSDDTVAAFWVTGSDYFVRIEGTTIDAATINAVVGHFSIENRYNPVTDYDGPTKAEMDTAHGLLATPAQVASELGTYDSPTKAEMDTAHGLLATPAQVATALVAIHLDHLMAVTYNPASKPGVADALLNEIVEDDGGVSRFTENSLEQAPSGTGASAATISAAVWDKLRTDHKLAGSFGENLQGKAGGGHYPNE